MSDEQQILTQIYDTYTRSKESFIDRNFATNRYYLSVSIFLMLTALVIYALTPAIVPITIIGAIGLVTSILWWLNLDSYQVLIKIKYSKVLEAIEDKLPAKPCQDEFKATQELKKKKHQIIFADLQKGFAFMILLIFTATFFAGIGKSITNNIDFSSPEPVTEFHTDGHSPEFPPVDVPEE